MPDKKAVVRKRNLIYSELISLLSKDVFTMGFTKSKLIGIFKDGTPEPVKRGVNRLLESYDIVNKEYRKLNQ